MQIFKLIPVLGSAVAVLLSIGCVPVGSDVSEDPQARASASSLDRVAAGKPVRKTLQVYTQQPGRIAAFEETPLFAKLAGYVETVGVDIGDRVGKDQLLVKLAIPELRDELEQESGLLAQTEAEVDQAKAALEASRAAANSARAMVAQAEASVGRVEGEYARWDSERQRIQQLVNSGSVTSKLADETLSQFRAAEAARKEATATIDSAKASVLEAEANVLKAEADLVAATARVRVSQANVSAAKTMLGYTEIYAPFDGVITSRNIDTGHFVQPANGTNSKPLLTIASTDRVRVYVDIPEMEAGMLDAGFGDNQAGDVAIVRVQALNNQAFEGRVTRSSWSLDSLNRSLRAEIDLPNKDQAMLPGGYATVNILLEQRDDVLTLPITAIIREGTDAFCCAVIDGKIVRKPIQLGLRSGGEVEIVAGLSEQDTVVLKGVSSLQPGQSVEVIGA
jgi:HlyD family secretion protein